MTPAKASGIRADKINGKEAPNTVKRKTEKAAKEAAEGRWTINKIWREYHSQKQPSKSLDYDEYRYKKYLEPKYGGKEPHELHQLDIDRLRVTLLKIKAPQTVKHVLALLKRLCNFGLQKGLCQGINFKIEMPRVDNQSTEDLSPDQLKKLLEAVDASTDKEAGDFMRLALFTGMRRGELIKLLWEDVDFDRGFINICHDPKGGKSQKIPLNDQARAVLKSRVQTQKHVLTRQNGKPFTNVINKRVREIRKAAGLPSTFRPLHGLRHVYASMLASSGQVDMYTLQKLLTHKSPLMTQRYAHLRDETMRQASNLAGDIITEAMKEKKDKVVEMQDQK